MDKLDNLKKIWETAERISSIRGHTYLTVEWFDSLPFEMYVWLIDRGYTETHATVRQDYKHLVLYDFMKE